MKTAITLMALGWAVAALPARGDEDNAELKQAKALLALGMHEYSEALELEEKVTKTLVDKHLKPALIKKANEDTERAKENYKKALHNFQAAAKILPAADLYFNAGVCLEKLDNDQEALSAFETYRAKLMETPDTNREELQQVAHHITDIHTRHPEYPADVLPVIKKPDLTVKPPEKTPDVTPIKTPETNPEKQPELIAPNPPVAPPTPIYKRAVLWVPVGAVVVAAVVVGVLLAVLPNDAPIPASSTADLGFSALHF